MRLELPAFISCRFYSNYVYQNPKKGVCESPTDFHGPFQNLWAKMHNTQICQLFNFILSLNVYLFNQASRRGKGFKEKISDNDIWLGLCVLEHPFPNFNQLTIFITCTKWGEAEKNRLLRITEGIGNGT